MQKSYSFYNKKFDTLKHFKLIYYNIIIINFVYKI